MFKKKKNDKIGSPTMAENEEDKEGNVGRKDEDIVLDRLKNHYKLYQDYIDGISKKSNW